MSNQAQHRHSEALRARRNSEPSTLSGRASHEQVKPEFYADARLLIGDVRTTYASFQESHPPYGLIGADEQALHQLSGSTTRERWIQLEQAMSHTITRAFDETRPEATTSCPYHAALRNFGRLALTPLDNNHHGLDRMREATAIAGVLAPAAVVNILRRVPTMAAVTGASSSSEALARASGRTLLSEPMRHPQQLAKAFLFCLGSGIKGSDVGLNRDDFMPDDLIRQYIRLQHTAAGHQALGWSMPTTDFTLRANVRVDSRKDDPNYTDSSRSIVYPIGTRLGDIYTDEPTIGCPGNHMAYDMWEQAVNVIVGEGLWNAE